MRIQHNIPAMSAYRNYTNNVAAMKKNLEKLSSGYKINRAGDDAAGLAISEKMRAQITGLETAQKNAKDGISLVQTAEGALTEVHDMLNRMVELASMSANGTYDDTTDRAQLQKELDQLTSEINRIADSSNFNGIKLLDGTMDTSSISGVKYEDLTANDLKKLFVNGFTDADWEGKTENDVAGGENVLETEGGAASKAGFQISMDGTTAVLKDGDTFTLQIGEPGDKEYGTISFDAPEGGGTFTSSQLAAELAKQGTVTIKDADGAEREFNVVADGKVLKFTTDDKNTFKLNNTAKVTWTVGDGTENPPEGAATAAKLEANVDFGTDTAQNGDKVVFTSATGNFKATFVATVNGGDTTWALDTTAADNALQGYTATFENGKLTLTNDTKGVVADASPFGAITAAADGSNAGITNTPTVDTPTWTDGTDGPEEQIMLLAGEGGDTEVKTPAVTATAGKDAVAASFTAGETDTSGSVDSNTINSVDLSNETDTLNQAQVGMIKALKVNINNVEVDLSGLNLAEDGSCTVETALNAIKDAVEAAFATNNAKISDAENNTADVDVINNIQVTGANEKFTVTFDKTPYTHNDAEAATAAKVDVDFANLTGADVMGDKVTIGGKTYEFVADAGDVTGGNTAVVVTEAADADALTTAFKNAVDGDAPADTAVTTAGTTVTVTSNTEGAGTLAGTVVDAGGTEPTPPGPGPDEPDGDYIPSGNLAGGIDQNNDLKDLDWEKGTTLTTTQVTALKGVIDNIGTNGKLVITAGIENTDGIEVDLSKVTEGADTIGKVAENIMAAAQKGVEAYNAANADGKQYEVVGVSSDAAGTTWLAGGPEENVQAVGAGDGFYIQLREKTDDEPEATGKTSSGTINAGLQNVTDNNNGESAQLANTVVDFNEANAWTDGAKITIGDTTYTVAVGEDSKFKNAANVVDLTDLKAGDADLAKIAAQRLTVAAKDNKIFTVGHNGKGETTLQQRSDVKESTDMTTKEKVAGYLGVSVANADSLENAKPGTGLRLQIGDTADSYNQLTVSIKDMHAASLGLDKISIADQDSAAAAIEKIKAAINSVSDVRGTLGATQNRLDHTINNLSVMTENIQDAESTIRDVDVAEEMMAYTKNNILIQSAQAMLAQANQMPQGVLQLLQ